MITFGIDELTPCLFDTTTETYVKTIVSKINKSQLKGYNSKTGWYTNWNKIRNTATIYGVFAKQRPSIIQGLIAIEKDDDVSAEHILWACVAPHNNKWEHSRIADSNFVPQYTGIGGHLLAIAANNSVKHGYEGRVHAEAMDEQLLQDHILRYGAVWLPSVTHAYHFGIMEEEAHRLMEVYDYEED